MALAHIEPTSEVLKAAIDRPKSSNREEDWATSIRIAVEIAKPFSQRIFEEDADRPERNRIVAVALQEAIDHDYFFSLERNFEERPGEFLYISTRKIPRTLHEISSEVIRGASFGAMQELLHRSASNSEQLLRNIRALCIEEEDQCWGVLRANLKGEGRIILQNGFEIKNTNAPAGVTIRSANIRPDSK